MGGVIACDAHGRGGEVGEMDGAGLGAWRRVRSPSWGTSLVLGSPVFWSPFVCLLWTRTGPRLLGSYLGGWSRKSGRIRLGLPHLCDVSRIWEVILRVLLLRVRAPRVDAGSVIRTLSLVPTELTVRVAECLGGPRNWGSVLYICSNRCTKMSSWNSTSR